MIKYVTTGAWGTGLGVALDAADIDGNFYDLDSRVTDLETNPPEANNPESVLQISETAFSIVLHDGSQLGPIVMPVLTSHWRDTWEPNTLYEGMDQIVVAGEGVYWVLQQHTSAATFDANAGGSPVTAGNFVAGTRYIIETVGTTDFTLIGAEDNNVGTSFKASDVGTGTGTAKPQYYLLLLGPDSGTLLDDLANVVITDPNDDHFLVLTGDSPAQWTNRSPTEVTALLDDFTGDDASPAVGGSKGLVPAPSAGDGAAGKYLDAQGHWSVPPGTFGGTLDDLTDVVISGISSGDILTWDGSDWVNGSAPASALDDLSDVVLTGPTDGDLLQFDGVDWINQAGTAISGLTTVSALDYESYLELSEPDDSSPALYTSKKIMLGGLGLTIGSTAISLGSTAGTIAGLTLSGGTLTDNTTLPAGGDIHGDGVVTFPNRLALGPGATNISGGTSYALDVRAISAGIAIVVSDSSTNATNKFGRFGFAHYTNSEEPIAGFLGQSNSTTSTLHIGGGTGVMNTVTEIDFYTAANNTTVTGTKRGIINSSGNWGIQNTNPQSNLSVGTTAGTLRVYNSFTDASNGEWGRLSWSSNEFFIGTDQNGTGTARNLKLQTGGTVGLVMHATSQLIALGPSAALTSSFPALKRNSTGIDFRLGDDSAFAPIASSKITTSDTAFMHNTSAALANGAAAAVGTLNNAPAAGDPTKWIPINDNGVTRYIPAW